MASEIFSQKACDATHEALNRQIAAAFDFSASVEKRATAHANEVEQRAKESALAVEKRALEAAAEIKASLKDNQKFTLSLLGAIALLVAGLFVYLWSIGGDVAATRQAMRDLARAIPGASQNIGGMK